MHNTLDTALDIRVRQTKLGQRLLLWALFVAVLNGFLILGAEHIRPIFLLFIFGCLILAAIGYRKINEALDLNMIILIGLPLAFLLTATIPFAHAVLLTLSVVIIQSRYRSMAQAAESRAIHLATLQSIPQHQPQDRPQNRSRPNPPPAPATSQPTPRPSPSLSTPRAPTLAAQDPEVKNARAYLRGFAPARQWIDPTETIIELSFGDTEEQKQNEPVCTLAHCGFMTFFVNDTGNTLTGINRPATTRLGIRYDTLYKIGIHNLDHYAFFECKPGIQIAKSQHGTHYRITLDGDFDASLMLLDKVWNHLEMRMLTPNGIIAAIPDRSTLLFCDAAQPDSIQAITRQSKEVFDASRTRITERLFIRRHHRWAEYTGTQSLTPTQTLQQQYGALVLPQLLRVQPASSWQPTLHNVDLNLTETDRTTQKKTETPAKMQHGGFIVAFIAANVDTKAMQRITEQQLTRSGLSLDELQTIAMENLYDLSGADRKDLNLYFKPLGAIFEVRTKDDNILEASLILLDDIWDTQIKALFSGPPIAALPTQNKVAFCDASSVSAIRELQDYATRQQTSSAQAAGFNAQLYIRENNIWLPYVPADQRATVYQAVERLQ